MLKKILTSYLLALSFFMPLMAEAATVMWDRPAVGRINPLFILDTVFGNIFVSTSTTDHSVFPFASTTALSTGTLCLTADLPCRTTWPTAGASFGQDWKISPLNSGYITPTTTKSTVLANNQAYGFVTTGGSVIPALTMTSGDDVVAGYDTASFQDYIRFNNDGTTLIFSNSRITLSSQVSSVINAIQFNFLNGNPTRWADTGELAVGGTGTSTFAGGVSALTAFGVGRTSTTTINGDLATSSFSGGVKINAGGLTIGAISGFLKATAGAVTTSLIDLANDVTGTLPVSRGGTGTTTSQSGRVIYGGGSGVYQSVPTTTVSCSGTASCTAFVTLGSTPITIIGAASASSDDPFTHVANFGVTNSATGTPIWAQAGINASSTSHFDNATSTLGTFVNNLWLTFGTASRLLYIGGDKSVQGVATTTLSTGTGLTSSAALGATVGGNSASISFAAINANSLWANVTGASAVPTNISSTSLYAGSAGQILAFLNGGWTGAATTTAGTGLTYNGTSFNVNASQSISTLSNLTTNGFVQTSSSNGTLGVQTFPCPYAQGCTGTTTAPVSQLIYGGATAYQSVGTTTASCAGSNSCTSFTIIGASPITITGSGLTSYDPFSPRATTFGTAMSATTSPVFFQGAIYASSTSQFSNASTTLATFGTAFINGFTAGQALYSGNPGGQVRAVSTSTPTVVDLTLSGVGAVLGSLAIQNPFKISTTTVPSLAISNLAYFTGTSPTSIAGVATTSVTCAGSDSCTAFTIIGASPIIITGNGITSYDAWTHAFGGQSATTSAIGIGTTTPFSQLSVSTSTQSSPLTRLFTVASTTGDTLFNVLGGGNVGVGTSSPGTLFSIQGSANFTSGTSTILGNGLLAPRLNATATSTFSGLQLLTGGLTISTLAGTQCLHVINGAVLGTGSDCGSGGGGTIDEKWATTTSTRFPSAIYPNASLNTLVGIGTSTPAWMLHIASSTGPQLALSDASATSPHWLLRASGSALTISTSSPTTLATTTNSEVFKITQYGTTLLGLGVNALTQPGATLHLYEQNGTGNSPSFMLGGNAGGDTDFWEARNTDNGTDDDDFFTWGRDSTTTGNRLMTLDNVGRLGVGSSTPWAGMSFASSTWGANPLDYFRPLFAVATSSDPLGFLAGIFATSTSQIGAPSYIMGGLRLALGTKGETVQLLDQVNLNGRLNSSNEFISCSAVSSGALSSLSSDTNFVCGNMTFAEDATGSLINDNSFLSTGQTVAIMDIDIDSSIPNNGAGLFTRILSLNGTSSPVMDVSAAIYNSAATGTSYYIGFTNVLPGGTSYEVEPTIGCYFNATTTAGTAGVNTGNWQAICRSSAAAITQIDTGVSSTTCTGLTGGANPRGLCRFRIESQLGSTVFYIRGIGGNIKKVATISTNLPSSAVSGNIQPSVYLAAVEAGTGNRRLGVDWIRVWVVHEAMILN